MKLTKCWVLKALKMWKRWELISTMQNAGRSSCDTPMNGRYAMHLHCFESNVKMTLKEILPY